MNILQISTRDQAGGAERIALTLHNELNLNGHDARMTVGQKIHDSSRIFEIPTLSGRGIMARTFYPFPIWMKRRKAKGARHIQQALTRLCEPSRWSRLKRGEEDFDYPGTANIPEVAGFVPDVLHAHNLHGGYFDLRRLPSLSRRYPMILTMHDAWLLAGHCAHSFECEKWVSGCGACPHLDTPPSVPVDNTSGNWNIKRDIYAASKLYVACVSRFLFDKLDRSMLKPRIAKVIYNGIDLGVFRPSSDVSALRRKWQLPEGARVALFASVGGGKNPWKDFASLEATMEALASRYTGDEKLVFLCVGSNGTAREMGNCKMIFTGYLSDQASMAECYQLADLYLHPSKMDSFPNVIIEAMACGVPSVASSVGGIPEQIQDGWNGLLYRPGDVRDMTEKSLAVLEHPEFKKTMGANGLGLVKEKFTIERQVGEYLKFYQDAMDDFKTMTSQ